MTCFDAALCSLSHRGLSQDGSKPDELLEPPEDYMPPSRLKCVRDAYDCLFIHLTQIFSTAAKFINNETESVQQEANLLRSRILQTKLI